MGLIRTALIGAAIYGAFKYITKKDILTGKSILDEVKEKAPEWMEKAKTYGNELEEKMNRQSPMDVEGYKP